MALPIISSVYRCTLNWVPSSGRPSHNIIHFSNAGNEAAVAADIDTALGTLAADSHLGWPLPSAWKLTTVDVLALDGTSTTQTFTLTNDQQGGAGGSAMYQVSGLVGLQTAVRGSRGRGRVYLGPAAEDAQANGILDATGKGVCQTAWTQFLSASTTAGNLMVVASYEHATAELVTTATVRNYMATQRRRARWLQA